METNSGIIKAEQLRIKKLNKFILENEETLIQGKIVIFNDKNIREYMALFDKGGYKIECISATSQLKVSL